MANYLGCWQKSFWTERKKRLMLKLLCSQFSSIAIHYLQLRNLETIPILTEALKTVHTVHCGRLSLGKWLVLHQILKIMNFTKLLLYYYPLSKISDLTSPLGGIWIFSLEKKKHNPFPQKIWFQHLSRHFLSGTKKLKKATETKGCKVGTCPISVGWTNQKMQKPVVIRHTIDGSGDLEKNIGINYQPQLVSRISEPSTVCLWNFGLNTPRPGIF